MDEKALCVILAERLQGLKTAIERNPWSHYADNFKEMDVELRRSEAVLNIARGKGVNYGSNDIHIRMCGASGS
jgi:hypothetical protein